MPNGVTRSMVGRQASLCGTCTLRIIFHCVKFALLSFASPVCAFFLMIVRCTCGSLFFLRFMFVKSSVRYPPPERCCSVVIDCFGMCSCSANCGVY